MPAKIQIEYDETVLKELILEDLRGKMPDVDLVTSDIQIEVKSTQNYKSEWETAAFRAREKMAKSKGMPPYSAPVLSNHNKFGEGTGVTAENQPLRFR